MSYNGKILSLARAELETIRQSNKSELERRTNEIYRKIPEIAQIDATLSSQMAQLAKLIFSGQSSEIDSLKNDNLSLQMKRAELLVSNGYPINYLDEIYSCSICHDTGNNGQRVCSCLDKLYNKALTHELSGLMNSGDESFDNFDLSLYPVDVRLHMGRVFDLCKEYSSYFPEVENLLLSGSTGLGKTYLSACIAKEISKKGYSVIYDTASACFGAFERAQFAKDTEQEEASQKVTSMLNCDLMILDDLGTEFTTQSVMSAFYTLINTRMINGKNTIINTNLDMDAMRKRYIEAICSRIEGSFTILYFKGNDIRTAMKKGAR